MSRIGKQPVVIPSGVKVALVDSQVSIEGPQGKLSWKYHPDLTMKYDEAAKQIVITRLSEARQARALHGLGRALVQNMVVGVTKGYEKKLELVGVGYRAAVQAKSLTLTLGYSHLINYAIPDGITIETPSQTEIIVKGIDRQRVGQTAAEIRGFRPPEPYKGKGVKYSDEKISLKEAKKK
jgi:large subunit ribosomal protein L6